MTVEYERHIYSEPIVSRAIEQECVDRTIKLLLTTARNELEGLRFRNQLAEQFIFPPSYEENPRTLAFRVFLATLLLPVSILMMLLTTVRYLIERGSPTSQRAILKYDVEQLLAGKLPDKFAETQRTIKFYVDADVPDEPAPSLTGGNPLPPDGTLFSLWKHYGPKDTMFNRDSCLGLLFEWVFLLYGSAAPTRDAIRACVDDIEESTAKSRAAILDVDGVMGVTLRDEPVTDVVAKLSHELGPY